MGYSLCKPWMVTSTLRDIGETNKRALLRIYAGKEWISMGYQHCQQTGSGSFSRTLHPMTVAATKPYKSITDHVKMDLGLMVLATKWHVMKEISILRGSKFRFDCWFIPRIPFCSYLWTRPNIIVYIYIYICNRIVD